MKSTEYRTDNTEKNYMYYQKIQNQIVTEQINANKSSLTQEVVQSNPALAFSAMHSCDMEVKEFIVHSRKK